EEVDPALIGGLQLRIGSKLIDASIATKLDRMNTAMKGA
ncbi:MAG: F0F1 ATP synthase subunit delta, partial [Pseudomonadota bacterium]